MRLALQDQDSGARWIPLGTSDVVCVCLDFHLRMQWTQRLIGREGLISPGCGGEEVRGEAVRRLGLW